MQGRRWIGIFLYAFTALGCASGTVPLQVDSSVEASEREHIQELRKKGATVLSALLAEYDSLEPGEEKAALGRRIDAVAGQRYATVSRLFWHTDMEEAKRESKERGLPILSLRMLGRLDEDISCANSRLFRSILYANKEVSDYLRENLILHWSSERAVPKITVDYGDGRMMKSTIAGNSVHYILTSSGLPVDAVLGLVHPKIFVERIQAAADLAARVDDQAEASELIREFHVNREAEANIEFQKLSPAIRGALGGYRYGVPTKRKSVEGPSIELAEQLTIGKAAIEMPMVKSMGIAGGGTQLFAGNLLSLVSPAADVLDEQSQQLIRSMKPSDWGANPRPLSEMALEQLFTEISRQVVADSLLNEQGLMPKIRSYFIGSEKLSFESLNTRVYSEVFKTPAGDPWLGMKSQGFTGLPSDGLEGQAK